MSEIKKVRLFPAANVSVQSSWGTIGGLPSSEAWKEFSGAAKEESFKGNTNGTGGSELLPSETNGIQASTTTGPVAAFSVPKYVLGPHEKLLAMKAVGRFRETTTKSVMLSGGGASEGSETVLEKNVLAEGTLPFWWEALYTTEDVQKLNEFPGLLKQLLESAAVDARMAKAKAVGVYSLYMELEIEVTSTVYTDAPTGHLAFTGTVSESLAATDRPTASLGLHGVLAEATTRSSTPTASLGLHGTLTATHAATETPTGSLTLTGALVDAQAHTTAPIGRLSLAAEIISTATYTDRAQGFLRLVGAIIESWRTGTPPQPVTLTARSAAAVTLSGRSTTPLDVAPASAPALKLTPGG